MASSTASQVYLGDESNLKAEIHMPKQTAIDKIGGIFCHICNSTFGNKKDFDTHYIEHKAEGIVYTCVVCKKQISSYPSFRGHCYLNHVVKNKFRCPHCSKTFCKLCVLNTHISTIHDYKCSSCDDKFTSKKDLETHKVMHKMVKDEPPYDCFSCGKLIKTIDVCESHIDDHCVMLYPCPICNEVFSNKLEATKHLTKHFDEKIPTDITISPTMPGFSEDSSINILGGILCCHCDSLFRNRAELDTHFMAEHEEKTIVYTCNICAKQYETYAMFGDHCYLHFSKDRFQCDQCYKTFPRLSLLVIHTEVFHIACTAEKPYTCEHCDHGFMTRFRLKEHMRLVHDEACILRCMKPGCSATFEKPRDLINHQKNHNALENWCRQCGLQFISLSSAEKHLDVHRRKQYSCPVCKREYREKYLMVKHVPVHFEAVYHGCKMCGKVYNARSRLMTHLKTHSELRNYKCTFCSKAFLKPFELKQHLNIHSEKKAYSCTLCPKTFANYPNWSKHLTRMHKLDKTTIKRLKLELDGTVSAKTNPIKTSPMKAESGIESAGSEMSVDLYTFVESDDSTNDVKVRELDWAIPSRKDSTNDVKVREIDWEIPSRKDHLENIDIFHTIRDPVSGETMSITESVNAVIDRIDSLDEDLDMMASKVEMKEFIVPDSDLNTGNIMPETMEACDITAIVEHIDAMSGPIETGDQIDSTTNNLPGLVDGGADVLQYANLMQVDNNTIFNNISEPEHAELPEVAYYQSGCQPEYGPDFFNQGTGLGCDGLINLDDHILPHIDPLLTIRDEENAKMYVQHLNNFNFDKVTAPINYETQNTWDPPIIKKVYHQYEENNDTNRMYIY